MSIELIRHLIEDFDMEYSHWTLGITAIPFNFKDVDCYIKVNATAEEIIVITTSCSKTFKQYIRHL